MNRTHALPGYALARPLSTFASVLGIATVLVACSAAAPGGESAGQTSQAVSSLLPPSTPSAFGAADLVNLYDIPTFLPATSTIAVIVSDGFANGDDPTFDEDLAVYRAAYSLPPCTETNGCLRKVNETGAASPLPPVPMIASFPSGETIDQVPSENTAAALDMASAACPSCKLLVVDLSGHWVGDIETAITSAARLGATEAIVATNSLYQPGTQTPPLDGFLAGSGMTVFAAPSGTWNASDLGLLPAASSSAIAVGCTAATNTAGTWHESATNACGAYAFCSTDTKPTWQHDAACSGRTEVDLSAVGGPAWTFNTFNGDRAGSRTRTP